MSALRVTGKGNKRQARRFLVPWVHAWCGGPLTPMCLGGQGWPQVLGTQA